MGTYLDEIVDAHRRRAKSDARDLGRLLEQCEGLAPTRSFAGALSADGLSVIAEVKRRSPSKGPLSEDLDAAAVATSYAEGGAAALSVLTDGPHFGGSADDLISSRQATGLPTLRKDFTVDERDVVDARLMGADAVLLIVAALDDEELKTFHDRACSLSLDVLVEVHDGDELRRARAIGATLIGVNQRDLHTFEVDGERARSLAAEIPPDVVAVAESGVRNADDAAALAEAGFDAILVGESVVVAEDRAASVRALVGHPVGPRAQGASR